MKKKKMKYELKQKKNTEKLTQTQQGTLKHNDQTLVRTQSQNVTYVLNIVILLFCIRH